MKPATIANFGRRDCPAPAVQSAPRQCSGQAIRTRTYRFTDRSRLDAFIRRLRNAARRSARNGGAYTVTDEESLDAALAGRFTPGRLEIEVHL